MLFAGHVLLRGPDAGGGRPGRPDRPRRPPAGSPCRESRRSCERPASYTVAGCYRCRSRRRESLIWARACFGSAGRTDPHDDLDEHDLDERDGPRYSRAPGRAFIPASGCTAAALLNRRHPDTLPVPKASIGAIASSLTTEDGLVAGRPWEVEEPDDCGSPGRVDQPTLIWASPG